MICRFVGPLAIYTFIRVLWKFQGSLSRLSLTGTNSCRLANVSITCIQQRWIGNDAADAVYPGCDVDVHHRVIHWHLPRPSRRACWGRSPDWCATGRSLPRAWPSLDKGMIWKFILTMSILKRDPLNAPFVNVNLEGRVMWKSILKRFMDEKSTYLSQKS